MICDKVSFGITDRLLVVDDFNGELAEVSCVRGPGISKLTGYVYSYLEGVFDGLLA